MTNFDRVPNRRNPNNRNKWSKWNNYPSDVLPLWVADMDFPAPTPILKALKKVVDHGVLGYEYTSPALQEIVVARMERLYDWKVKPETVVGIPGVVSGCYAAADFLCSPRRGYVIQTPVYNSFHEIAKNLGVPQLDAPMAKRVTGNILTYEIEWDVFEKQVKKAGMFLLCSPHNPLGINFSRKELKKMAEICLKHGVTIVSDEIHSELLLDGNVFTPMASLSSEIAKNTITLIAASKTFNVAGMFCGFAIIPNKELRAKFEQAVSRFAMHTGSMGLFAARAAFSGACDGWLDDLRLYLARNRDFLVNYVAMNMPGVRLTFPEATYLGWLDFTQTHIKDAPFEFFLNEAKVALSDGKIFGQGGEGHLRINFGTTQKILGQALDRMAKAYRR